MANVSPTTRVIPSFDPFDVKSQLVDLAENYFNLDNIDLYESGFMGYLIQALTTVTSDTLYQNAFSYNEAFLDRALLRSSVSNIASQLDYSITPAIPARGSLTVAVPIQLGQDSSIKISSGSSVDAGGIPYKVYNTYYIKQDSTGIHITSYNIDTGLVDTIPYTIELHNGNTCVVFGITIWQVNIYTYDFTFDNPTLYQFYTQNISGYSGDVYKVIVSVENEKYSEISTLYTAQSDSRNYELNYTNGTSEDENKVTVKFGNGVYGYQPKNGASGTIIIYTTLGESGNIIANTASLNERFIDTLNPDKGNIEVISTNPLAINNGKNSETLEEIKRHVKENVSAAKRLVTEADYAGYAGVTGLTNIQAYPILDRRNMNGNEITIYNALFDNDNRLIPTASIPMELHSKHPRISKGEEVTWTDGITYVSPFEIVYDSTYDIPRTTYIYNMSTTNVSPVLFADSTPEDVEMSLNTLQVKFFPNENQLVYTSEIYKLDTMSSANIRCKLFIDGFEPIELKFTQEYNSKTIVNMASNYINYLNYPTGEINWTVKLYYVYPDTTEEILYNTYYGTFTLLNSGEVAGTIIETNLTSNFPDTFLSCRTGSFNVPSSTSGSGSFLLPVILLKDIDLLGNQINVNSVTAECIFNGTTYNMSLYGLNSERNVYTFSSPYIDVRSLPIGSLPVKFNVYSKVGEDYSLYNTYSGDVTIIQEGKSVNNILVTVSPESKDVPNIELIHLSVSSIKIESENDGKSYKFTCNVNKLHNNSSNKITAKLVINTTNYDLSSSEEYMMEYGGDMVLAESEEDKNQTTVVVYRSPSILTEYIPTGSVTFKIELKYNGENITTYKQSAIFKQDISRICKSDIHQFSNNTTYACSVPVIEKSYYEQNVEYLDNTILSQFLDLSTKFNEYGMLTDRINIKFVRTCGESTNMRLNKYKDSPIKVYDDSFYVDLPVKIHAKVYVSRDTTTDISTITTEAKNIIYTFLSLKSGFNTNIYRSEISRFLHDSLNEILFCEIVEPVQEIIYDYDIQKIPYVEREEFFKFCPEYVWFDRDNIQVDVILM